MAGEYSSSLVHDPRKKGGVVIHGDLRAVRFLHNSMKSISLTVTQRNVLVGLDHKALLCDFGLAVSLDIDEDFQTNSNKTNHPWLAYEFYQDNQTEQKIVPLTVKTDVYAFGCICYEV